MNLLIGTSRFFIPAQPEPPPRGFLRRSWALAFAVALSFGAFWPGAALAADDPERVAAALSMVERRNIGSNMSDMAWQAVQPTTTFAMILFEVGAFKANHLLRSELAKARPKYQPQWNQNLAESYARFFTVEELRSLERDGKASPVAEKLQRVWNELGVDMKAHSQELLAKYAGEALSKAFAASRPATR